MKIFFSWFLLIMLMFSLAGCDKVSVSEALKNSGLKALPEKTALIDFTLKDLTGNSYTLSDLRGRVVILNFWTTWCPFCKVEMPSLEALYQEFKDKGLVVLAVDLQEGKDLVVDFLKDKEFSFIFLLDETAEVASHYNAYSLPTTYIIDKQGYVVAGVIGALDWKTDAIKKFIKTLLP